MEINQVVLSGNLTKNPDLRYTREGKAVAQGTIAVNGFKENEVVFVNLTFWEKKAEVFANFTRKGDNITIVGKLVDTSYEKDGKKIYQMGVTVFDVKLPPKKQETTI